MSKPGIFFPQKMASFGGLFGVSIPKFTFFALCRSLHKSWSGVPAWWRKLSREIPRYGYPLVMTNIAVENHHFNGKTHYFNGHFQ